MPGRLLRLKSYGTGSAIPDSIPEDQQSPTTTTPPSKDRLRDKFGRRISPDRTPDKMDVLKRHSLAGLRSRSKEPRSVSRDPNARSASISKTSPSPALRPTRPVNKLDVRIESGPNVFYGNPTQSSGALMSGQLLLTVADPDFALDSLEMTLYVLAAVKKPVQHGCPECTSKRSVLKEYKFVDKHRQFDVDEHTFPFSFLFDGNLPATTKGVLGVIEYRIEAKAVTAKRPGYNSETIELNYEVPVMRALTPVPEKNSLRIFPPTNLTAHVTLAPVIHPIGESTVLMKLNGLMDKQKDTITRWKLRKMNWTIQETEKIISPACTKHSAKLGGEGKGIAHEDVRVLGEAEIKEGWKNDFSDGTLEMEFYVRPSGDPRPLCDVAAPTGLEISHALVVELVVAEEWAPVKKPEALTPTGAARVLRMQFQIMITERSGMGISWDEEQPPVYEDVPASPPVYAADDKRKLKMPTMPASAHLLSPSMVAVGSNSRSREPSALRFASFREYTGPPLDGDSLDEEVERLDLRDGDGAGPSAAHIADHARPSARSRRRLDLDDFMGQEEDPRGPPPPPRDDD